jgi:hypothetical protein
MELINKIIMSIEEFKEEREELKEILTHAFQREDYKPFGEFDKAEKVLVPEEIRRAYFELFHNSVDKKSIQHGVFQGAALLDREIVIPFYGRSSNGANFVLSYLPARVDLEISAYSFNRERSNVGIREIGLISTQLNGNGNFQTDLKVGDTFAYRSGYTANHNISGVIDKIQKSKVIPHIPREQLVKLSGYLKRYRTGKSVC